MRALLYAAILLASCAAEDIEEEVDSGDSHSQDSSVEPPACAPDGFPSGDSVGETNCSEGICAVPGGLFWRGQASGDADACPLHQVELSAFRIDQTEVSQGEYRECVDAGACKRSDDECNYIAKTWDGDSDRLPVICVDYIRASSYCEWKGGRLPSEAEWEKAARGEEGAVFPWGERAPLCEDANFRFVSWYCQQSVVEVGSYPQTVSAYGLLDTLGNAWEWTADSYDARWYWDASRVDPGEPESCAISPDADRGDCTHKVIRGGAFNTTQQNTRASVRSPAEPGRADLNLGLRCAYD